jgi:hypothetical protein
MRVFGFPVCRRVPAGFAVPKPGLEIFPAFFLLRWVCFAYKKRCFKQNITLRFMALDAIDYWNVNRFLRTQNSVNYD